MSTGGLKIGELATRCGVSRDTVRFYERKGLLPLARRTDSRHRIYDEKAEARLRFIRRAQEMGLTLEDIRQLLGLRQLRAPQGCRRVAERLRARLEAVDDQMANLATVRRRLRKNLALCDGNRSGPCPVVERLEQG